MLIQKGWKDEEQMNTLKYICLWSSINLLCGLVSFLIKVSSGFAFEQAIQHLAGVVKQFCPYSLFSYFHSGSCTCKILYLNNCWKETALLYVKSFQKTLKGFLAKQSALLGTITNRNHCSTAREETQTFFFKILWTRWVTITFQDPC